MADAGIKEEVVWVRIPLPAETAQRLRALADVCHNDQAAVAASLLHDILKDDEDAHFLLSAPPAGAAVN